ncbi:NrtR DNA-binding winged helix domain-containing protein [Speluncibacter jeojiensis]|uniref:NUDIX hydrolase n=1 Tax=Speluncibacter jeojiensis TaxID=2710754 RepID=A0A9X4LZT4_9ACTN|nr:NUDIX hydrolase [Corynebacteriales bacterium D3-21]
MSTWTDKDGKTLTDYPRPSVAVDVAVLTVVDAELHVVVVHTPSGTLALPGTFLRPGERLSDAAERALRSKARLKDLAFQQLAMFDKPGRDDRGWVLSMAHGAALAADRLPPGTLTVPLELGRPTPPLAFDHAEMVESAVDDLRQRYARRVDPAALIGETFTVLALRRLYDAIFARALPKDTFRRLVVDALEPTGEMSVGAGRPAELFRRRAGAELPPSALGRLLG